MTDVGEWDQEFDEDGRELVDEEEVASPLVEKETRSIETQDGALDIDLILAQVAVRTGHAVTKDDPLIAALVANEIILAHYRDYFGVALKNNAQLHDILAGKVEKAMVEATQQLGQKIETKMGQEFIDILERTLKNLGRAERIIETIDTKLARMKINLIVPAVVTGLVAGMASFLVALVAVFQALKYLPL